MKNPYQYLIERFEERIGDPVWSYWSIRILNLSDTKTIPKVRVTIDGNYLPLSTPLGIREAYLTTNMEALNIIITCSTEKTFLPREAANFRVYKPVSAASQVIMWINRKADYTTLFGSLKMATPRSL
jgi:hypothetical protein